MVTIFKNFNEVVEHKTIATILEEIKTGKYKDDRTGTGIYTKFGY